MELGGICLPKVNFYNLWPKKTLLHGFQFWGREAASQPLYLLLLLDLHPGRKNPGSNEIKLKVLGNSTLCTCKVLLLKLFCPRVQANKAEVQLLRKCTRRGVSGEAHLQPRTQEATTTCMQLTLQTTRAHPLSGPTCLEAGRSLQGLPILRWEQGSQGQRSKSGSESKRDTG